MEFTDVSASTSSWSTSKLYLMHRLLYSVNYLWNESYPCLLKIVKLIVLLYVLSYYVVFHGNKINYWRGAPKRLLWRRELYQTFFHFTVQQQVAN